MMTRIAVGLPTCAQATYRGRRAGHDGNQGFSWANPAAPASIGVYLGAACLVARDRSKDDR
jgi:hypothetical protein